MFLVQSGMFQHGVNRDWLLKSAIQWPVEEQLNLEVGEFLYILYILRRSFLRLFKYDDYKIASMQHFLYGVGIPQMGKSPTSLISKMHVFMTK